MRLALLVVVAGFAVGCSSGTSCLPAIPQAPECGDGIFGDASTTDPLCLTSDGLPLCRGGYNATCYVCSGGDFADNCLIKDKSGSVVECVHHCDGC